jgi:hypothetical protein
MMFANVTRFAQAEGTVAVTVISPELVETGENFVVTIGVGEVAELNAAQYDISFDKDVLLLEDITPGLIGSTTIDVMSNEITPGVYRIVQTLLTGTVSGSGYLAQLHFRAIGVSDETGIGVTNGLLSGMEGEIPAGWTGSQLKVYSPDYVRITLVPGWNLVSMPYTVFPADSAPDIMLSDIAGAMRAIYKYDACTRRFSSYNTHHMVPDALNSIADGTGYWLYMDEPGVLTVFSRDSGGGVPPAYTNVCTGYNLIGPRIGNQYNTLTVADWLGGKPASAVLGWNSQTHSFYILASTSYIQPGMGYFVYFDGVVERAY